MPSLATAFPSSKQWFGVGKEATPGTAVLPTNTIPIAKGEPDDKPAFVTDTALRGSMATDYNEIKVSQIADFSLNGPVFLDTIGHLLLNAMGDYVATGSTPTNSTTLSAQVNAGATSATVVSGTGYAIGQNVQLGILADGNPEVVTLTNVSGTTLTFANTPARFTHASAKTVATVVAPFTHVFSLLNSGNGQPPTHTLTHYQGLAATTGARQYAYWCASGLNFSMDSEQLFSYDGAGSGVLGVVAGSPPTNSLSTVIPVPNWRFTCGIGGPATGGTLAGNITGAKVNMARVLKPYFPLNGAPDPAIIARAGLSAEGALTVLAQDESPLTALLANNALQLQFTMSNGLAGANLLAATFDIQAAVYNQAKLTDNDHLFYDVAFRAVANSTNAGQSGGWSPLKVTVQNAVPTY